MNFEKGVDVFDLKGDAWCRDLVTAGRFGFAFGALRSAGSEKKQRRNAGSFGKARQ